MAAVALVAVQILLAVAALYGAGMWLFLVARSLGGALAGRSIEDLDRQERYTFHLGLCAIVASGFLGVILALSGAS